MASILKTDEIQSQNGSSAIDIANGTLKHPSASGNNLVLGSDGSATIANGTLSAGTIGSGVTQTKPAFLVQAQAMSNLAQGGYTDLQYVTVIKNEGGGTYNTGTYTYTAPVSGLYYISASAMYSGFPNNVTDFRVNIVTSNRTYEMRYAKFINAEHPTNYTGTFRNSTLADLDANDTVKIQVYQNGGSSAADLTVDHSYFSGFLVSNY